MSTSLIGYDLTAVYTSLAPSGAGLQSPDLGAIYEDGKGNKYKFCKNANASTAFVVGDFVAYSFGGDKTSVKTPATGLLASMAGVAMGAIAALGFGWVQINGIGSGNVTGSASNAAGTTLKITNAAGVSAVFDQAVDTLPTHLNHARCTAALAVTGVTTVVICCPNGV